MPIIDEIISFVIQFATANNGSIAMLLGVVGIIFIFGRVVKTAQGQMILFGSLIFAAVGFLYAFVPNLALDPLLMITGFITASFAFLIGSLFVEVYCRYQY